MQNYLIKYAYLIRLDSGDGSAEPAKPARVRFVFDFLADHAPAKMSCEIDTRQPQVSKCRLVFDDSDLRERRRGV